MEEFPPPPASDPPVSGGAPDASTPTDPSGVGQTTAQDGSTDDARRKPTTAERVVALLEVILCSDYPTQLALAATFAAFGLRPFTPEGTLSAGYVFLLSIADTLFLVGLIVVFLKTHGEHPRDVLFGSRSLGPELRAGIPLTAIVLIVATAALMVVQKLAPGLHNVERNPMQDLIRTPLNVAMFAVTAVVAGGIREEIQRAFLLHRFEGNLGGPTVGVIVTSVVFGAGHVVQGLDSALAIGLIGALWAVIYVRRRSIGAPVVSHACFNLLQIVQFLVFAE